MFVREPLGHTQTRQLNWPTQRGFTSIPRLSMTVCLPTMTDASPQYGIPNTHFEQLRRAVEAAGADNRFLVLQEGTAPAGERAYFLTAESVKARTIRNIKAALGLSDSGKQQHINIKNAFIKLAIEYSQELRADQSKTVNTADPLSSREAVDQVISRLRSVDTHTLKDRPVEAFIHAINNS